MASFKFTLLASGLFAATTLAHGTVTSWKTDGKVQDAFLLQYAYTNSPPSIAAWSAKNLDNGFVDGSTYTTSDIICHKEATPGKTTAQSVAAGGTVDFLWSEWPESHIGPVFTYIANCNGNCSSVTKTDLKWVKIDQAGIDLSTQTWASSDLIKNNNTWTTTIPSTLAAGNYVLRHEIIAMHAAGSTNGAQNYPQCFNVEVTGDGTESPDGVIGTELYTNTEPGILFNPYTTLTNYTIPGPALWSGAASTSHDSTTSGSSSGSSSSVIASASATKTASSATVSATKTSAATSVAATATTSTAQTSAAASKTSGVAASSITKAAKASKTPCSTRRRRRHARDVRSAGQA